MTLQQCRRTESFIKKATPNIDRVNADVHSMNTYETTSDDQYWDKRYRDEGELYNNLSALAKELGFIGQAVPAVDKTGMKAYIIGNMMNETDPKALDRAIYQVRPDMLKRYMEKGYALGQTGAAPWEDRGHIKDLAELKDVMYHLIGRQSAADFPDNDLETFFPADNYIGPDRQGQYTLLPSSSTRKEFGDDGLPLYGGQYVWWESPSYDRKLIMSSNRDLVDSAREALANGPDAIREFISMNPKSDKLLDAIRGEMQANAENISKHVPSKGAITGVATQNIYPAVSGLRTIAPYLPRKPTLADMARAAQAQETVKPQEGLSGHVLTSRELKNLIDRLKSEGKGIELSDYEKEIANGSLDPNGVPKPAINPTVGARVDTGVVDGPREVVTSPKRLKEGVKYNIMGGKFVTDPVRGETIDPETGEVVNDTLMVARSASEMFERSLAARKSRKDVVTDESGNIDVVQSSTSSLFERMKRRR